MNGLWRPLAKGEGNLCSGNVSELFQEHMMCYVDSLGKLSASYFGKRSESWIDHCCIPQEARSLVKNVSMLTTVARSPQLVPDRGLRDHVPMRVVLAYDLRQMFFPKNTLLWNHDKIASMYQSAERR